MFSVMREKAEDMLFDDKKKGDEEEGEPVEVVNVSDEEVIAAGRKTRIGLVVISIAMFAFCVGMSATRPGTVVVGGSCGDSQDRYHDYEHCWNLKENWCAQTQCAQGANGLGTAIDPSTLDPTDPNACPQGCSVCGTEVGQTEKWIEQLKTRAARTPPRSEVPTMDHDGSLANYRGYKTAHPSSQQGASEAFIQRDAFRRVRRSRVRRRAGRNRGGGLQALVRPDVLPHAHAQLRQTPAGDGDAGPGQVAGPQG